MSKSSEQIGASAILGSIWVEVVDTDKETAYVIDQDGGEHEVYLSELNFI